MQGERRYLEKAKGYLSVCRLEIAMLSLFKHKRPSSVSRSPIVPS